MKFLLLEKLGIPRLRVKGISIFNVLGTIFVAWLMTSYIEFFNNRIDCFQMSCLMICLAAMVHFLLGDYTPLVKLVMTENIWKVFLIVLALTGFVGHIVLKCTTICFTLFLLLKG
jgi:hypothetical protein